MEIFFEIFESCFRMGPGDDNFTIKAYNLLKNLPDNPSILDIGSGKGAQSLILAKNFNCHITAIDNHQPYIDYLNERTKNENLSDKITALNMNMFELDFPKESFDIIWSEGAIYFLGFEKGLATIKPLLKTNGYAVVSELVWLTKKRPKEIDDYLRDGYPAILDIEENICIIKKIHYNLIDHFSLLESSWNKNYYEPLQESVIKKREKYKNNKNALEIIESVQLEINMYKKYSKYFGYEFYIMQK